MWRTKKDRVAYLIARDGDRCFWCHFDFAVRHLDGVLPNDRRRTLDHVIPRSQGGTSRKGNLVLACWRCNHRKADDMPEVWVARIVAGGEQHVRLERRLELAEIHGIA